jgi:hypothetical protein
MSEDGYRVYVLPLPEHPRVPHECRTKTIPLPPIDPFKRQVFEPDFINPKTFEERLAWFRWVVGHQSLFHYWLLMAEAYRRVSDAVQHSKPKVAAFWLRRANLLKLGSIGVTMYSGSYDSCYYQELLRPSMERVRDDFTAYSSLDFYRQMVAEEEAGRALRDKYGTPALNSMPEDLAAANQGHVEAKRNWLYYHSQVAKQLQPGDALLDIKLKKLAEETGETVNKSKYIKEVAQSPQAQADYDRFFGVVRQPSMFVEDFYTGLRFTLAAIHKDLSAVSLDAQLLGWMREGDDLMLAIVSELLDPPSYNLAA